MNDEERDAAIRQLQQDMSAVASALDQIGDAVIRAELDRTRTVAELKRENLSLKEELRFFRKQLQAQINYLMERTDNG